MDYTKRQMEAVANCVEPRFPGFGADFTTFTRWALKGIVRNLSQMEAPTASEWEELRATLEAIIDEMDEAEEVLS